MLLHSDSEELQHAYDPQKAHEYYLKTRKLKGRRKGTGSSSSGRPTPGQSIVSTRADRASVSVEQKRKEQAAKVQALKGKLDKLQNLLKQLTEKLNARSGDDAKSDSTKSSSEKSGGGSKDSKDRKPLTAKQKADARDRAKESYEKNNKPDPKKSQTQEEIREKIADVREQIRDVQQKLREAREMTPPIRKTALKGR